MPDDSVQIVQQAAWPPPPFNGTTRWSTWKLQLEMYMKQKGVSKPEDKALALLQSIGGETLEKIVDWCAPKIPTEKSYDQLITLLNGKFEKAVNKFAMRVQLFNQQQAQGQSTQDYFAEMTQLVGKCGFETMVKPAEENGILAILRGIASDELRQYLLLPSHKIETITDLQNLAMGFEATKQAAFAIQNRNTETPILVQPKVKNAITAVVKIILNQFALKM
uniref:Retrotransposon gag domain-containing protein n=1 Tax=Panagrolaimus superbus TaxID=310955 RepID=A0A914XZG5_9BILA